MRRRTSNAMRFYSAQPRGRKNIFTANSGDKFKLLVQQVRDSVDQQRSTVAELRNLMEDNYDMAQQRINDLKALIDEREANGKPIIALTAQLQKALGHAAALHSALSPLYVAEAYANTDKVNEMISEMMARLLKIS